MLLIQSSTLFSEIPFLREPGSVNPDHPEFVSLNLFHSVEQYPSLLSCNYVFAIAVVRMRYIFTSVGCERSLV
jgi:hypothetical protein